MLFWTAVLYGPFSLKIIRIPAANIASGRKQALTWWIWSYFGCHCLVTDSKGWHNSAHRAPSVSRHLYTPSSARLPTAQQQPAWAVHLLWGTWSCCINCFLPEPLRVLSWLHTASGEGWCLTWENPLCVGLYLKGYIIY